LKAGNVRGAQAKLARAMPHENTIRILLAQSIGNPAGAILRIVVDDKNAGRKCKREELRNHRFDVFGFVVRWENNDRFHSRADYNIKQINCQFRQPIRAQSENQKS
jgi:hypothetical protein